MDYIRVEVEWVFVYDDLSKWSEFLGSKVCVEHSKHALGTYFDVCGIQNWNVEDPSLMASWDTSNNIHRSSYCIKDSITLNVF